jgi:hypothetical protein
MSAQLGGKSAASASLSDGVFESGDQIKGLAVRAEPARTTMSPPASMTAAMRSAEI